MIPRKGSSARLRNVARITSVFSDKPAVDGLVAPLRVDLNADLGEYSTGSPAGNDAALMPLISSASIACGGHAGDEEVMRQTILLARDHGVSAGAHPSFPDREGFGRRDLELPAAEVEALVREQVAALAAIARVEGIHLRHVKPHGALYNLAASNDAIADAVARAAASVDPSLILFGLAGSALVAAGRRAGLRTASEAFADRAYRADGSLVPRSEPGALIDSPTAVAARALAMVRERGVPAIDGTRIALEVDTICVHGDTPGAAALARSVRAALLDAGIAVKAVGA